MIKQLLLVGLGGGVGSMLRYLSSYWATQHYPQLVFPFATFFVNITGCFLIGLFVGLASKHIAFDQALRYLLVIGFCGGYTTFSAFSLESIALLEKGHYGTMIIYTLASICMGLIAFIAGQYLSKT